MEIEGLRFVKAVSAEQLDMITSRLADRINQDYAGREVVFLVVLNGAFMFASDLLKKIEGVRVPVLEEVVYSTKEFSLFSSPKWFADGFEQLKAIADVGIRQEFVRRKVDLLDYARKKTTQKVNLFEKVQIPGYQDAIRKIKRFMEDEENLSKSSQKIVKSKREAEARAAEEQARKEAAV